MIKIYYRFAEAGQAIAHVFHGKGMGGKSELHRARRSITWSPGNGKESATERETTLRMRGKGEKVSRRSGFIRVDER